MLLRPRKSGEPSDFESAIYRELTYIPAGTVVSYGQLADVAGYPGYSRHVGRCLKNLPRDSELPWHRVLRANGEIAFPRLSPRYQRQKQLLLDEGVTFKSGRADSQFFRS